jgi:hypothetical protein
MLRETMSKVHRLTAVVIVIVAAVLAVFTSSQTLVPTARTVPVTSKPLPVVDLSATPAGWIPVAFGDAQVSVPATWFVAYRSLDCAIGSARGEVFVNPRREFVPCPAPSSIGKTEVAFGPPTERTRPARDYGPRQVINGITVYGDTSYDTGLYIAPSLGIDLIFQGPLGNRVLHTLTRSPRVIALVSGPGSAVQYRWHTLTFQGLSFTAPAWWQVTRTLLNYGIGSPCASSPGVSFYNEGVGGGEVVLSTDQGLAAFPCPSELGNPGPVYPGDGIEVDAGPNTLSELATEGLHLAFSAHCLDFHGLKACPATTPTYSILVLRVRVPGRSQPVFFSIGLAGNGLVARTILYSLRAA